MQKDLWVDLVRHGNENMAVVDGKPFGKVCPRHAVNGKLAVVGLDNAIPDAKSERMGVQAQKWPFGISEGASSSLD